MIDNPAIFSDNIQSAAQFRALDGKIVSLDENIGSFLRIMDSGKIVEVRLIDVDNSFSGVFSFNGKLFNAQIPKDLYNEFVLSSTAGNNSGIKVKLQLTDINSNKITFKIINNINNENIKKAVELYNLAYSDDVAGRFKSVLNGELNLNTGAVNVSVKGNFLFIHFNFNTGLGNFNIILTGNPVSYRDIQDNESSGKKLSKKIIRYSFMIEMKLEPLGYIKIFSYYINRSLSVNFKNYSDITRNAVKNNLSMFKDMLSSEGIALKEISFSDKDMHKNTLFNNNIINETV